MTFKELLKYRVWVLLERFLLKKNLVLSKLTPYNDKKLLDISGEAWDYVRIYSLELAAAQIAVEKLEGNTAEVGVYKGDFAKLINRAFPGRKLYLFDTFEGFSADDLKGEREKGYSEADETFQDTDISLVMSKMVCPEDVIVKKGYFPATAEGVEDSFVFVSLDADHFQPIYDGLRFFYPRLVKGGFIFIHDYNTPKYKGVKEAVEKYRLEVDIRYFPLCDLCGSLVILK